MVAWLVVTNGENRETNILLLVFWVVMALEMEAMCSNLWYNIHFHKRYNSQH